MKSEEERVEDENLEEENIVILKLVFERRNQKKRNSWLTFLLIAPTNILTSLDDYLTLDP